MAKFSTGLRTDMLDTATFKALMDGGVLNIYGGVAPPDSANDAVPGAATLIVTLTDDGGSGGLNWGDAEDSVIAKATAQTWRGENQATAEALWFRFVADGDDGSEDADSHRVQGTVGTVSADLLLGNTTLTNGENFTLNFFSIAFPTL